MAVWFDFPFLRQIVCAGGDITRGVVWGLTRHVRQFFRSRLRRLSVVVGSLTWLVASWWHLPWLLSCAHWVLLAGVVGFVLEWGLVVLFMLLYWQGPHPRHACKRFYVGIVRSRVGRVNIAASLLWLVAPWLGSGAGWLLLAGVVGFGVSLCGEWFLLALVRYGYYSQALLGCRLQCGLVRVLHGKTSLQYAFSRDTLAKLYLRAGRVKAAEPLLGQALAFCEQHLGATHPVTAEKLCDLGHISQELGRYAAAEEFYRRALDIRKQGWLGDSHQYVAIILSRLAELCQEMGRYDEAQPYYRQALAIAERDTLFGIPYLSAIILGQLASLYRVLGRYDEAESSYSRAQELYEQHLGAAHPQTADLLHWRAILYQVMGRYEDAEHWHTRAQTFYEQHLGATDPTTIGGHFFLASLYQHTGRYDEAVLSYTRVLAMGEELLGATHPALSVGRAYLADLYRDMGRYGEAEPLYTRALAMGEELLGATHPSVSAILHSRALLYVATGRSHDALQDFQKGIRIENDLLARIANAFPEAQVAAFSQTLLTSTHAFLTLVWRARAHDPTTRAAGLDVLLARKAIAYDAAATQHTLTALSPALQDAGSQLRQAYQTLAVRYMQGPAPGTTPEQHQDSLHTLRAQCAQLEETLASQVPAMAVHQRLRAADRAAIAQALPAGSTLVEWVRFLPCRFATPTAESAWEPARYVAFLLPAGAPDAVQLIDCGEADAIDLMIARFYVEIAQQNFSQAVMKQVFQAPRFDPCRRLYDQVFAPLLAALAPTLTTSGTPHLIMAPDGPLGQLPFGALLSPANRFVVEDYLISYVTVGREVVQFHVPLEAGNGAVIVADPDYNLSLHIPDDDTRPAAAPGDDLPRERAAPAPALEPFLPLDGARAEGQAIADLLCKAGVNTMTVLIGPEALEGHCKNALHQPRIVHLATHGFFLSDPATQLRRPGTLPLSLPDGARGKVEAFLGTGRRAPNPLLCAGLAFAGFNAVLEGKPVPSGVEDGVITALDVLALNLHGTELVILAACQTGQGGILYGDGVAGFRRAFTLAGTRTLVVALWNVPDEETRWLMEEFYTTMLAGQGTLGKAAALRQAQLALLQQLREWHGGEADPRLWAGFLCQGDPAPLQPWSAQA